MIPKVRPWGGEGVQEIVVRGTRGVVGLVALYGVELGHTGRDTPDHRDLLSLKVKRGGGMLEGSSG